MQNGTAERFVGSVRRELLDHIVVLNEEHLRRLVREYVDHYNTERVHTSIGDAPVGRPVEPGPLLVHELSVFHASEVSTTVTLGAKQPDLRILHPAIWPSDVADEY